MKKKIDRLPVFERHGFIEGGVSGDDQAYGDCPLCGASNKFYVNRENYLWDCKRCGKKGNLEKFMAFVAEHNHENLVKNKEALTELCEGRGLPEEAFTGLKDFGFDGSQYSLLVRDHTGKPVDIRMFNPKQGWRARSTKTCKSGLFGQEQFNDKAFNGNAVMFCEGEWDGIAMRWLAHKLRLKLVVVATGGADVFKREWAASFKDRDVVFAYDNDAAGERGELIGRERISALASSLLYTHWPTEAPSKFDLRDWIVYGAVEKSTPRKCWKYLKDLWQDHPRQGSAEDYTDTTEEGFEEGYKPTPYGSCPPEKVYEVFSKWLHMKDDEALAVTFGTMLANELEGDPLWLFLIAPPGGMKSELLMSLAKVKKAYLCSSLTPHALVSGANFGGGGDPSMMPKLNEKVLVLKDFTTTLTMHPTARDEIFGQLRDSYDGKFEKFFGNGIVRNYESRFGILAGCTPNIDAFSSLHAGLGERFLKYRFEGKIEAEDEASRIRKALSNVNKENGMREALQGIVQEYFNQVRPDTLPTMPDDMLERMISLAMLTARLRGVVHRDNYNPSLIQAKACHEVGTRVGKQLSKLAIGVSMYYHQEAISERTYEVVARVAMASLSDKVEELVRTLYVAWKKQPEPLLTKEVVEKCPALTRSTIQRCLEDMQMLKVVEQEGVQSKKFWRLSDEVLEMIDKAEVFVVKKKKRKIRRRK
jgi:hypothetical protein